MQAIELVKNRNTKEPAPEETAYVFERTRENGLVLLGPRSVDQMQGLLCLIAAVETQVY